MKRPIVALVALVLAVLVLAPNTGALPRGDHTTGTASRQRVRIIDNRFRPSSVTIDRGTVVKWKNRGTRTHTTTSNTGLWDSGSLLPGDTFRRRFRRRGTFRYHCTIHTSMRGTITVT